MSTSGDCRRPPAGRCSQRGCHSPSSTRTHWGSRGSSSPVARAPDGLALPPHRAVVRPAAHLSGGPFHGSRALPALRSPHGGWLVAVVLSVVQCVCKRRRWYVLGMFSLFFEREREGGREHPNERNVGWLPPAHTPAGMEPAMARALSLQIEGSTRRKTLTVL